MYWFLLPLLTCTVPPTIAPALPADRRPSFNIIAFERGEAKITFYNDLFLETDGTAVLVVQKKKPSRGKPQLLARR
jgi:hypothetical protein